MRLSRKEIWLGLALLSAWLCGWLWVARHHLLDDALIHLRYGELLRQHHFFTYDGERPSFGCSSILYVTVTAVLSVFWESPLLPKYISIVFYIAALIFVLCSLTRSTHAKAFWLSFLLLLVSPMSIRWLTDGMETSAIVFAAMLLADHGVKVNTLTGVTALAYLGGFLLGVAIVLLRIEFCMAILFVSCTLWLRNFIILPPPVSFIAKVQAIFKIVAKQGQFAAGGLIGLLSIFLCTGHLLPDTAVAKATHLSLQSVFSITLTHFSAMSFGLGMPLMWMASALAWMRLDSRARPWALIINASALILMFIIIVRGQTIQGVRYFVWSYILMTVWNLKSVDQLPPSTGWQTIRPPWLIGRRYLTSATVVLAAVWIMESAVVYRIVRQRGESFTRMRHQHLEVLSSALGTSEDFGFIGYFTKARILDIGGLVNGREFAQLTPEQRLEEIVRQRPVFAFVNAGQAKSLRTHLDIDNWKVCERYDFPNLRGNDTHYLIVAPFWATRVSTASIDYGGSVLE